MGSNCFKLSIFYHKYISFNKMEKRSTKMSNNIKISNGFIFNSKLDEVILVSTSKLWTGFKTKCNENNVQKTLSCYVESITNNSIKEESWKQVCELVNIEQTWKSFVFMTVVSNIEDFCSVNNDIKTRIFRIASLNINECPISVVWKIYMCLDINVQGTLSRIICYS
jgi:hypothetical protein